VIKARESLTMLLLLTCAEKAAFTRDFFAVIDQDGTIVRGRAGIVSALRDGSGRYEASFNPAHKWLQPSTIRAHKDLFQELRSSPNHIWKRLPDAHARHPFVELQRRGRSALRNDCGSPPRTDCSCNPAVPAGES